MPNALVSPTDFYGDPIVVVTAAAGSQDIDVQTAFLLLKQAATSVMSRLPVMARVG